MTVPVPTSAAQWLDDVAGTVTRKIGTGWTGERLLDWTGSGSNIRIYGENAHHDTTWLASNTGSVSQALRYDPWGTPRSTPPVGYSPFRFQGSWHDEASDLAWVVTRWYAPSLGRFVSEDTLLGEPIDPPSRHLYAYVTGEPVGLWDPTGRYTECVVPLPVTIGACVLHVGWTLVILIGIPFAGLLFSETTAVTKAVSLTSATTANVIKKEPWKKCFAVGQIQERVVSFAVTRGCSTMPTLLTTPRDMKLAFNAVWIREMTLQKKTLYDCGFYPPFKPNIYYLMERGMLRGYHPRKIVTKECDATYLAWKRANW